MTNKQKARLLGVAIVLLAVGIFICILTLTWASVTASWWLWFVAVAASVVLAYLAARLEDKRAALTKETKE